MVVFYIQWSNFALNISILIRWAQFCLFLFTSGFSLRMSFSNHFKEFHKKNKTATLAGECWWQGGEEDFWELSSMPVASTGLELPWVQGLCPCGRLWICFKRERAQGWAYCEENRGEAGFHEEICNGNSGVCLHTLRRSAVVLSL